MSDALFKVARVPMRYRTDGIVDIARGLLCGSLWDSEPFTVQEIQTAVNTASNRAIDLGFHSSPWIHVANHFDEIWHWLMDEGCIVPHSHV